MFHDEAFIKIYGRFRNPIFRYVKTRIADHGVAEEITQDVFFKAHRFRERYLERYAFSTWLWTIARNTVSDYLRAIRGTADDGRSSASGEPVLPDELASPDRNAEALVLEKDQRRTMLKMMRSLTRLQRRVLRLRLIHQLSYAEISRRLGLSLSSVKNLAYRARLTLFEGIHGYCPEVPTAG